MNHTEQEIEEILGLIDTLRAETETPPGHGDPGAIQDNWVDLRERITKTGQHTSTDSKTVREVSLCIHAEFALEVERAIETKNRALKALRG